MIQSIPYGKQQITDEDIQAVVDILKSDYLTQGPKVNDFEEAFANYIGSKYAVAVSNGTAALHLSTMVLGVKENQKVITTPLTFAASANCIAYCGSEVVFSDIDAGSYLIDLNKVEDLLKSNDDYVGIIPVDFAGSAVNLEDLRYVTDKYGLWVLEDACHAPGGYFKDKSSNIQKCGNGKSSDLAIFSFHPVKHIAAGEGGMITTNNAKFYQSLLKLRTHGITRDASSFMNPAALAMGETEASEYPGWYMEMQALGYNYRLTDIQAALGLSQLQRANEGLEKRKQIAKKYFDAFDGEEWLLGQSGVVEGHAYHLYVIEVVDRLGLYNYLRENNIYAQVHYIPVHLMPYYQNLGWKYGDMPLAEKYYSRCLSLPMFPSLNDDEQSYVISKIKEYYNDK